MPGGGSDNIITHPILVGSTSVEQQGSPTKYQIIGSSIGPDTWKVKAGSHLLAGNENKDDNTESQEESHYPLATVEGGSGAPNANDSTSKVSRSNI